MESLFPDLPVLPSGFVYFPDFLTPSEEMDLCDAISKLDLHTFLFQGYEAKRKIASFGYDYNFEQRTISKGKQIPPVFDDLLEKVAKFISMPKNDFAELLVTEYPIGSVINWHRDAPPFELIAGISLLTDCTFRLRPHDKMKQNRKSIISFTAQRRSLYIMQGLSRTAWQHSTSPVKAVRYSITLRTLRNNL